MYPLDIRGITGGMKNFIFNDKADEQTISQLVGEIPPNTEVGFYDKDYPSPSDPGAFVIFSRVNNQYRIRHSNHGWSNKSELITMKRLIRYLSKCSAYNKGPDFPNMMFANLVRVEKPSQVTVSLPKDKKWWQFWR